MENHSLTTYKKMKCFNLMTGEFVGYLGTHDNYVTVTDAAGASDDVVWASRRGPSTSRRRPRPTIRFLGLRGPGLRGRGPQG